MKRCTREAREARELYRALRAAGLCTKCKAPARGALCEAHAAAKRSADRGRVRPGRVYRRKRKGGRPRTIPTTQGARWAKLYAAGHTVREIAAQEGVSLGVVLSRLREMRVAMRPVGRRRRWSSREIAATARQVGVKRAAEAHGCSLSKVYEARREVGTTPRRERS